MRFARNLRRLRHWKGARRITSYNVCYTKLLRHGFSAQPVNLNLEIHPNYDMVVTLTPDQAGTFGIICNEYCGIGHHTMVGKIYVKQ